MSVFSGKCLCGNVTYKCHAEPTVIFNCHCEDCRRATGSVFGTNFFVPEDELEIFGEVSSYSHTADSGSTMTKRFCPNCGSLLFGNNSAKSNVVSIRAGTVDQLDLIKPVVNVFMDSKVSSTSIDKNLKQASRMPL
tara:strand:+ start:113 stop:520 length:408 start_codon:yes stop_codon:yes gene_type:complete